MVAVRLVLEDGTEMSGTAFGAVAPVAGEVVFNTGMAGYVETLTDPSYRGQILVCTYPLVGNYGVPAARDEGSIDAPFESSRIQVQGLVVQHYVAEYSHYAAERSLGEWLGSESVPGLTGIDTRTLTRRLREEGTMAGWLFPATMSLDEAKASADAIDMSDEVFRLVAPSEAIDYGSGTPRILLVDVGAKDNMVRSLLERGASVRRVPWHTDLSKEAGAVDGIIVGNGPGDPGDLGSLVDQIRGLFGSFGKTDFRHLPRKPNPVSGGGRRNLQAALRPSRREPTGPRPDVPADPTLRVRTMDMRSTTHRSKAIGSPGS